MNMELPYVLDFLVQYNASYVLDFLVQYNADAYNTHAHSPLWTHVRKFYPYEYLRRTGPADLEISEVTIGTSLSTGTSLTT